MKDIQWTQKKKKNIRSQISTMCNLFFFAAVAWLSIVLFAQSSLSHRFLNPLFVYFVYVCMYVTNSSLFGSVESFGNYLPFPRHNDD